MKEKRFYIGLALIVISFIACVMSFYLLVFGIPVFLVGATLVFLSKQTIQKKLLTTLMPIVLYFPLVLLFLFIYNYSTSKAILIPKDFDGTLRVVYEEKCGRKYDKIEGVKTLSFPNNGILILDEDFDRHVSYKYYLVDELGRRAEIPQILNSGEKVQKRPCVLVNGSGSIGQATNKSASGDSKGITYSDFYVYNKDTIDRSDYKSQQKIDSLMVAIVNQCRQQK